MVNRTPQKEVVGCRAHNQPLCRFQLSLPHKYPYPSYILLLMMTLLQLLSLEKANASAISTIGPATHCHNCVTTENCQSFQHRSLGKSVLPCRNGTKHVNPTRACATPILSLSSKALVLLQRAPSVNMSVAPKWYGACAQTDHIDLTTQPTPAAGASQQQGQHTQRSRQVQPRKFA